MMSSLFRTTIILLLCLSSMSPVLSPRPPPGPTCDRWSKLSESDWSCNNFATCKSCTKDAVTGKHCTYLTGSFSTLDCNRSYNYGSKKCNGYSCDSISGKKTCSNCSVH
ncbi:hypothetical protein CROQUDRAFT_108064 [Cronartium quercuum f. sp. fusiforme G11]|uniref:Uncharacterized protein n=1 Tax=Cronartium quercuum f. sp. fusiforme G11 TaxID=708437 RepID=A0A9P6TAX4_9BASI|nr:hypothetical protein CROQUDRAFT_108064 [Cronartium quercuum f. sp. fusiforme G11]